MKAGLIWGQIFLNIISAKNSSHLEIFLSVAGKSWKVGQRKNMMMMKPSCN